MADKDKYKKLPLPGDDASAKEYLPDSQKKKAPQKDRYKPLPLPGKGTSYLDENKKKPDTSEMIKLKKGGASKNLIKDAIKKPGALKKSLSVKKGEKIPAKKLAAAAKKPGKMGQRARLAQTLGKMKRG